MPRKKMHPKPETTRELVYLVGREKFREFGGVPEQNISRSITMGQFPAPWWLFVQELCKKERIEFNPDLVRALDLKENEK